MYYPDRIGLTLDGPIAVSSDLGKSWVQVKRPNVMVTRQGSAPVRSDVTVFAADMDLSVNTPVKTILGFLHHGEMVGGMFVHTSDGGATWDWSGPLLKDTRRWMRTGVADATTLLRGEEPAKGDMPQPGIFRSTDFGQTWTKVGDYTLHGTCPVHYGSNIYWAAKEGVVVSRDGGNTWSVCGSPVANIVFGPYFGKSEQEMMVVSFKTDTPSRGTAANRGPVWRRSSPTLPMRGANRGMKEPAHPLSGRHWRGALWYFGWDSERNILYESLFGGDVWKLQLGPTPAAR